MLFGLHLLCYHKYSAKGNAQNSTLTELLHCPPETVELVYSNPGHSGLLIRNLLLMKEIELILTWIGNQPPRAKFRHLKDTNMQLLSRQPIRCVRSVMGVPFRGESGTLNFLLSDKQLF